MQLIEDASRPLIKLEGRLASRRVVFMVDCGATNNFVDSAFAAQHRLPLSAVDRTVRLADGSASQSGGVTEGV